MVNATGSVANATNATNVDLTATINDDGSTTIEAGTGSAKIENCINAKEAIYAINAVFSYTENGFIKEKKQYFGSILGKGFTESSISNNAPLSDYDTTKGSIETRLTNLGFKTGVAEITQTNCTISTNSLKKMGKWCIFNFAMSTSSSKKPSITITIPVGFRPKEETKIILVQTNTSPMKAAYYRVLTNGKIGNFSSSVEFNPGYGVEEMFLNAWWELE